MSSEGYATLTPRQCPTSEQLAEYLDNMMKSVDRQAIEEHLVDCSDCRAILVEASLTLNAVQTGKGKIANARLIRFPRRWKWTGAVAAMAAAAVIAIAIRSTKPTATLESRVLLRLNDQALLIPRPGVPSNELLGTAQADERASLKETVRLPSKANRAENGIFAVEPSSAMRRALEEAQRQDQMEAMIRDSAEWKAFKKGVAQQTSRQVEGRLMEFEYARPATQGIGIIEGVAVGIQVARSSLDAHTAEKIASDTRKAAEKLEEMSQSNPRYQRIAATALLTMGEAEKAVKLFEDTAHRFPPHAYWLNDLAVAYLATNKPSQALAAAERAILFDPTLSEPYFNRALALEKLGRDASTAWRDAINYDPSSQWATEARLHLLLKSTPGGDAERTPQRRRPQ